MVAFVVEGTRVMGISVNQDMLKMTNTTQVGCYSLSNLFFVDHDECLSANGGCHINATCTNSFGGRTCTCKSGFSGNGISCASK